MRVRKKPAVINVIIGRLQCITTHLWTVGQCKVYLESFLYKITNEIPQIIKDMKMADMYFQLGGATLHTIMA